MKFTILGSSGFIGQHLKAHIESLSYECFTPPRDYKFSRADKLGHVIYSIGLTADFRQRPFETVDAHVCKLIEVINNSEFDSFLYLSSTRIYNSLVSADENSDCIVNPNNSSDLYNISKLMGESICLSVPRKTIRVARLSNVVGNDFNSENFLVTIVKSAIENKSIELRQSLKNSKDYINVCDVVKVLLDISIQGDQRIYNVASGVRLSNQQILEELNKHMDFKLVSFESHQSLEFPPISINRIREEFGFIPSDVLEKIKQIIEQYKKTKKMIKIDTKRGLVISDEGEMEIGSPEAFKLISDIWLRSGWDAKYVYSFSWMGRPIIQLPEDMIRTQEVIFNLKPDVIVETGIAHGGSLVFYASLCKIMGKGRLVGVDIEIRPHNKKAITEHFLSEYITMIEGSSVDNTVVSKVKDCIKPNEKVMVLLDSNHTFQHVLDELRAYSAMVSVNSYIVATDGIMENVVGAPRTNPDWITNNPKKAAEQFVKENKNFIIEEPTFPFNEGVIKDRVTYWPSAFIKRIS